MEKIKKMIADGQTQKALSLLNEHLANHPEDDQAWFLKGNAYRKLGETRLALNSYLEAIAINPDSPAKTQGPAYRAGPYTNDIIVTSSLCSASPTNTPKAVETSVTIRSDDNPLDSSHTERRR